MKLGDETVLNLVNLYAGFFGTKHNGSFAVCVDYIKVLGANRLEILGERLALVECHAKCVWRVFANRVERHTKLGLERLDNVEPAPGVLVEGLVIFDHRDR